MLTTIYLNGILGKRFGHKFILNANTPREIIDLIDAGKPGFRRSYLDMPEYVFRVRIGKRIVRRDRVEQLNMRHGGKTISITPVLESHSSTKGIIETIAGIVLFVVGFFVPGVGGFISSIGLSLTLSGVASLIAGSPKTNIDNTPSKNKPSYQFSGPQNIVNEGGCVPVFLGGPGWIGSDVVSEGIFSGDITDGSSVTGGGVITQAGGGSQGPTHPAIPIYQV